MKDQQELFTYSDNAFCRRGLHAELRDDDPIIGDTFVNIDHVCSRCGLCVASTSWTRKAWNDKETKTAQTTERRRDQQGHLQWDTE